MPYLIDGHNLIPKIPGLHLQMVDDEDQLIRLLQDFAQSSRKSIEVYFDKAPPGYAGTRKVGGITACFVREGDTADRVIAARLRKMKNASGWTVVSSDHQVQSSARIAGAEVMPSETFVQLLFNRPAKKGSPAKPEPSSMSSTEMEEWLRLFSKGKD